MNDSFNYPLLTMQTGMRPMLAFREIFQTLQSTICRSPNEEESHFGSTFRYNLEVSLSDTTILMVYALTEGFFFEEYDFYFDGKEPKNLAKAIDGLFKHLDIHDSELISDAKFICELRQTRNAITHRNGILKDAEKQAIHDTFKDKISTSNGYPYATIETLSFLLDTGIRLISKYCELALFRAANNAQYSTPT